MYSSGWYRARRRKHGNLVPFVIAGLLIVGTVWWVHNRDRFTHTTWTTSHDGRVTCASPGCRSTVDTIQGSYGERRGDGEDRRRQDDTRPQQQSRAIWTNNPRTDR